MLQKVQANLRQFWLDTTAVTSLELALIAGLVSVAVIAGASTYGTRLGNTFSNVATRLPNV